MRFFALAAAASGLFTSVYAFNCASNAGTREQIAQQEHEFQAFVQNQTNLVSNIKQAASVPVYWNILYDQNNATDGNYAYVLKTLDKTDY
jgi:flagellar basal body-associated protein FliL